jgi:hypothetical protein
MKITSNTLKLAQQIKLMPDIFGTNRLLPYSQEPIIGPCHETSEFTQPSDSLFL